MNEKDYKLSPEDRKLLTKDLCARLPYGVIVKVSKEDNGSIKSYDKSFDAKTYELLLLNGGYRERGIMYHYPQFSLKPYLRPMSSMTDEEAMKVAELWGLEDILSISVKENYISVELDDGVAGSETYTIWFKEMVSSIELFDWLNSHYFDYRGLIPMGLALEAPKDMYNI